MDTYGKNPDTGYYERCVALEENRGKGRCHHAEHVKLSARQAGEANDAIGERMYSRESAGVPSMMSKADPNGYYDGRANGPSGHGDAVEGTNASASRETARLVSEASHLIDAFSQGGYDDDGGDSLEEASALSRDLEGLIDGHTEEEIGKNTYAKAVKALRDLYDAMS